MMKVNDKIYQMKSGKPFELRDIDRLFYACCYLDSNQSFLMEKEKFDVAIVKGIITEQRAAVGL
ncbi:hypothetical protein TEPIDINF_001552 [Tepidibacillus infernus]|uniref:Uncharacterized protein n=1 Tax=Tepidibacillus decaturensis TaxID=1413211 RepID=A0A135L4Z6_9BACI|nr:MULTISPECIES: hypothetical protein [Tepidibacillus]KXG44072.1 hypothetical protein U473_08675 [Tepidibacillus decaturensis]GBF10458.1 hypothetical protein HK1_00470 [Tepidibacillus sp. HK-1]